MESEEQDQEVTTSDQKDDDPRGDAIEGGQGTSISGGVADKISAEDVPDDLKEDEEED